MNNSLKKEFKRIVAPLLPTDTRYEKFTLHYKLYLPNLLKRDIANVLSITDKFFSDALVECGIVPDDNYEHLTKVTYEWGGYDEDKRGYTDVTVTELPILSVIGVPKKKEIK